MTNLCDVCGKPATQSMLRDPFGKSDEMRFVCSDHGFRIRDPADVAAIEQLHAAVKTAQELAARRLMEIERLQSNQREHNQEITELTQNRDDYKADYLRMHKMFMDLKYPDTVPAHEPCEQLPAQLAWGLESKLPGENWKVYWALYSDRDRAEQAAKNGRPEGTEWRVVTYARMPERASRAINSIDDVAAICHSVTGLCCHILGSPGGPCTIGNCAAVRGYLGGPEFAQGASRDASSEPCEQLDAGKTKLAIAMLDRFRDGRLQTAEGTHTSLLGPRDQLLQEADWFDHAAKVLRSSLR